MANARGAAVWAALRAIILGALASTLFAAATLAQTEPQFRNLDSNGVDIVNRDLVMGLEEGSIGQGDAELSLTRQDNSLRPSQWDAYTFTLYKSGSNVTVKIGLPNRSLDIFTKSGSNYVNTNGTGSTLTSSASNSYTYKTANGTAILFDDLGFAGDGYPTSFCGSEGSLTVCDLWPRTITAPDGHTITFTHGWRYDGTSQHIFTGRIWRVTNNYGYQIRFAYIGSGLNPNSGYNPSAPGDWLTRVSAKFYNTNVSNTTAQATVTYAYPSAGVTDVTTPDSETTTFTSGSIKLPDDSTPSLTTTVSGSEVTSATLNDVTVDYSSSISGGVKTTVLMDENSNTRSFTSPVGERNERVGQDHDLYLQRVEAIDADHLS